VLQQSVEILFDNKYERDILENFCSYVQDKDPDILVFLGDRYASTILDYLSARLAGITLIAAASLLSLGSFAATTITPAYAGGDNGEGVKQKAEAEAECDQKNKVEDGNLNLQTNTQIIGCIAASINANDIGILSGGGGGSPMD
jgi:hypothetical protein